MYSGTNYTSELVLNNINNNSVFNLHNFSTADSNYVNLIIIYLTEFKKRYITATNEIKFQLKNQ